MGSRKPLSGTLRERRNRAMECAHQAQPRAGQDLEKMRGSAAKDVILIPRLPVARHA